MSGKSKNFTAMTGNKWFPIAEQRRGPDGSFRWVPMDDCPFYHSDVPLVRVRTEVKRGNLLMATRKIAAWHYELVVKIPQAKLEKKK